MPHPVAEIFREAAEANLTDSRRTGNLLRLSGPGRVHVVGDLHGRRANLNNILRHADLERSQQHYLILQEIIHAPPDPSSGRDRSFELLLRAVRLGARLAGQVVFLMGNHDLSQVAGPDIIKDGRGVCEAFRDSVIGAYGPDGPDVFDAVTSFLRSGVLAVLCDNGVLISHSLPSTSGLAAALDVLERPLQDEDLARGAGCYQWVWSRRTSADVMDAITDRTGATFFVTGHRKFEGPFERFDPRALAIASDDADGSIFEFDMGHPLPGDVEQCVRPLMMLDVPGGDR